MIGKCLSKKDLRMGDLVDVISDEDNNIWEKRIFIKHGDNGIIVVQKKYEEGYLEGRSFDTQRIDSADWRMPKRIK